MKRASIVCVYVKEWVPLVAAWCVLAGLCPQGLTQPFALVPWNAQWRYSFDAGDQGTGWQEIGFDDAGWPEGPAPLGFPGDEALPASVGPVATAFPSRGDFTVYFRSKFTIDMDPGVASLLLSNVCDDGCVIYLNGEEIARFGMPAGAIAFNTGASRGGEIGTTRLDTVMVERADLLVVGMNVLAVEVHQDLDTSSDVINATALMGVPPFGPVITDSSLPADRNVVQGRSSILRAVATGAPPPTYQWYFNPGGGANPILNATNPTYTIASMSLADAGQYFCRVTGFAGSVDTRSATIAYLEDVMTGGTLAEGLVSYWPLDEVQGTKTPDRVSGYDMNLNNLSAADLVTGIQSNCFTFSFMRQTLLSRVHSAGEDLPINQHESFTISFWANAVGTGQLDLRFFSEGNTTNSNPLFNLGTHSTGADGTLDLFFRQTGAGLPPLGTVDHIRTLQQPFNGMWHHVVFVQGAGMRRVYIDGVLDGLAIPDKPEGAWSVNDTTIGGILRASASHWVTGLIDEVALWKRALTEDEITELNANGLESVFPPLADGLVSHWPLDEVQGTKTPDVVSGYDMNLNNLSAADLVTGIQSNCFTFSFMRQTLLSRVHSAGEDLPINQHESFTISFWANAVGTGQLDLRFFSEGNTTNSNPLFNLGTHSTGADGTLDLFFRQTGAGLPPLGTVDHIRTLQQPFNGMWHHVVFVQGAGMRRVYIDGVLDGLAIPDKPEGAWSVNDTTIGGILRASASHWVTGLIDEVALWKRALTEDEITELNANGVPKVFTKPEPLAIRSFTADFPTAVMGDTVVLRWEVTKNANVTIDQGVGNVAPNTVSGTGSIDVPVNQPTTFTLTVSRGGETTNAQVSVGVIGGVAAGWRLLENFQSYAPGSIVGKGAWKSPDGVVNVVDLGLNKAVGFEAGNDLSALLLQSLSLNEGNQGTLFFRLYVSPEDPTSNIGVHVGLTERPIRFWNDFETADDIGPYVRFQGQVLGQTYSIAAKNGVGSTPTVSDFALSYGKVYNLWLDIVNDTIANGDIYTVYGQEEGAAERTLLFDAFIGDRNPAGTPDLGQPTPHLISLLVAAPDASQSMENVFLDDFYLSLDTFNSTVPVPASNFRRPIRISQFIYDPAAGLIHITWNTTPGALYSVLGKERLDDPAWTVLVSDYPLGGATGTSITYTDLLLGTETSFFQILLQE